MRQFNWLLLGLFIFGSCGIAGGGMTESSLATTLVEAVVDSTEVTSVPIHGANLTTDYNADIKNRTTNMVIATNTINGIVLQPDEVFSFNEVIGKTTKEKGYKPAKIFVRGKEEQGMGGGICQVSSTLYNAADFAGLEIVERHPHSKKVTYVKEGRDAATSYGGVDLKFRNTLPHPVKIVATAVGGKLTVGIEAVV
ncbi:MAG: VanW family protein [Defluviitaleaceae bacterium]|nr:VanW family protein [Defluviitaleaceae bacterium]